MHFGLLKRLFLCCVLILKIKRWTNSMNSSRILYFYISIMKVSLIFLPFWRKLFECACLLDTLLFLFILVLNIYYYYITLFYIRLYLLRDTYAFYIFYIPLFSYSIPYFHKRCYQFNGLGNNRDLFTYKYLLPYLLVYTTHAFITHTLYFARKNGDFFLFRI